MSKLSLTEAVAVIPVSESTLRRDLKRGKVSFDTDTKGRKQFDVSELTRVYGQLSSNGTPPASQNPEPAEPVKESPQTPRVNGNETHQKLSLTDNAPPKMIELLEGQVQDLKAQLAAATTEKAQLLELANNLQKQNEVLMLPPPEKKDGIFQRLAAWIRPS